MAYKIEVKEEARQDIADAMKWYSSKSQKLDLRFLNAVENTILQIKRNPFAFKKIYKLFRQTAKRVFPYVIVYEISSDNVIIYAVFNTWQNPQKKIKRIRKQ